MKSVRMDFPAEWNECNVYTLSDLHIGDAHADDAEIQRRVDEAKGDPHGVVILNGDLMNTATRNSVSDVYSEVRSPMEQIEYLCKMLKPIKDKIVGVTTGNHEARVYRTDGIDTMRLVCRELGIEDRYAPDGIVIFLRFGIKNGHHRHKDRNPAQMYVLYATHGSGGGRKEGAKAIRLADMASIVDADVYLHSHTHLPMVMKHGYYRTNPFSSTVTIVERLFVNTGAALGYGGYGQAQEFKPASMSTPVITLYAKCKKATARM